MRTLLLLGAFIMLCTSVWSQEEWAMTLVNNPNLANTKFAAITMTSFQVEEAMVNKTDKGKLTERAFTESPIFSSEWIFLAELGIIPFESLQMEPMKLNNEKLIEEEKSNQDHFLAWEKFNAEGMH